MIQIFIACPPNTITGGIELLHQLCYQLNTYKNIEAYIWYIGIGRPVHQAPYKKYNCPITDETKLTPDTILVFPEIWVNISLEFTKNRKIIYWESVDNYFVHTDESELYQFGNDTIHLAQSYYALDFLQNIDCIDKKNIIFVSDYLNEEFLENYIPDKPRLKQVVYNPSKGYKFTEYLINTLRGTKFIPIKNMSREQVKDLLRSSMLYIDFGDFPGKDRIPREAVISGCCLITGKNGAAKYKQDVNISDKYKFERDTSNVAIICNKIVSILDNYELYNTDFEDYRTNIRNEYKCFLSGVEILVNKLSE